MTEKRLFCKCGDVSVSGALVWPVVCNACGSRFERMGGGVVVVYHASDMLSPSLPEPLPSKERNE